MPGPDPLLALAELPGVAVAVDEAREAVDRLRRQPAVRRFGPAMAAESSLRGARAAAVLDTGVDARDAWSVAEVRRAVRDGFGSPAAPGSADDGFPTVLRGALRAYSALDGLADTWRRAPMQVLARLHTVAAADVVVRDELGRPRSAALAEGVAAAHV
ncbi:MAG: hypothetical protein M3Q27_03530, partial [Actinomycetota bacterium]|nr:hypothetical protein [Actinomycetota bacterium]